jgi:short-subunit dehydrogenase
MSLNGKTLFITGASRGIGLAIGLRAARDGADKGDVPLLPRGVRGGQVVR